MKIIQTNLSVYLIHNKPSNTLFSFSQVDFIKLPPTVRTFGKRCYIYK